MLQRLLNQGARTLFGNPLAWTPKAEQELAEFAEALRSPEASEQWNRRKSEQRYQLLWQLVSSESVLDCVVQPFTVVVGTAAWYDGQHAVDVSLSQGDTWVPLCWLVTDTYWQMKAHLLAKQGCVKDLSALKAASAQEAKERLVTLPDVVLTEAVIRAFMAAWWQRWYTEFSGIPLRYHFDLKPPA